MSKTNDLGHALFNWMVSAYLYYDRDWSYLRDDQWDGLGRMLRDNWKDVRSPYKRYIEDNWNRQDCGQSLYYLSGKWPKAVVKEGDAIFEEDNAFKETSW